MKIKLFAFLACSILNYFSFGQDHFLESGGGLFTLVVTEDNCLTEEDRTAIKMRLRLSAHELREQGKLSFPGDREDVNFIWPLRKAEGFSWNSYYGISNFVDQDEGPSLLDYHCDDRTYEGHRGTDIFTWPFPWYMVENDLIEVVAGEEGVIIEKDDGFDDDHCECFGSWNAVYVQHADGSVAWYGHMKKGSLTDKEIGDEVEAGEFLGVVASSGCSTGPHLHLEVYDEDINLIDPYAGDCNDLNPDTWWEEQPDNREPTINTILTHDAVPEHGCPTTNEDPHMSNEFFPGDVLYTAFYHHDALEGTISNYRLRMPDETIWEDWSNEIGVTFNASWWWWSWTLPEEGPYGVWTLEADYEGETVIHEFTYGVYAGTNENESNEEVGLYPNPSNLGFFNVSGITEDNVPITICDATGQKVISGSLKGTKLNVETLSNGVYYVEFTLNTGVAVKKIMINE